MWGGCSAGVLDLTVAVVTGLSWSFWPSLVTKEADYPQVCIHTVCKRGQFEKMHTSGGNRVWMWNLTYTWHVRMHLWLYSLFHNVDVYHSNHLDYHAKNKQTTETFAPTICTLALIFSKMRQSASHTSINSYLYMNMLAQRAGVTSIMNLMNWSLQQKPNHNSKHRNVFSYF